MEHDSSDYNDTLQNGADGHNTVTASGGSSYGSMGSMEPPLWAGATTKKY